MLLWMMGGIVFLNEEVEDTYILLSMDSRIFTVPSVEKTHSGYVVQESKFTARNDE